MRMLMSLETRITGRFGMAPLEVDDDGQNLVVGLRGRQSRRQFAGDRFRLQEEAATGQFARRHRRERCPVRSRRPYAADDFVERARDLAGIAGDFRHALLVVVEFLQGHDRQEDRSCSSKRYRQVGSCISTLVSRTKSFLGWRQRHIGCWLRVCGAMSSLFRVIGRVALQSLADEIEHFLRVPGHFDAAPFAPQDPFAVDDKGAAFDAANLLCRTSTSS
jgi:hypothetical protein